MVKANTVDGRRRVVLPDAFQPGCRVLLEQIDEDTWILQRYRQQKKLRAVKVPVLTLFGR